MATNILTQERVHELLTYDPKTGYFFNRIWRNPRSPEGARAGYVNTIGYVIIQVDKQKYGAHRLAWLYMHGVLPTLEIDHINRIRSDNRIANLRLATRKENANNISISVRNTSGRAGVTRHNRDGLWQAQIYFDGKMHYLGCYTDFNDAVAARVAAERKLRGA